MFEHDWIELAAALCKRLRRFGCCIVLLKHAPARICRTRLPQVFPDMWNTLHFTAGGILDELKAADLEPPAFLREVPVTPHTLCTGLNALGMTHSANPGTLQLEAGASLAVPTTWALGS